MDKYNNNIATFNAVADKYWEKFKDFKLYESSYDWFCEYLPNNTSQGSIELLEIACGPGNVSRYLLNKNPAINLFGIDLAPKMVALAQFHNPEAYYLLLDCRQILSLDKSFDAIMCGFCLPYISWQDSQKLLKDMATKLIVGGVLYLSFTEGKKNQEGFQSSNSAAGEIYLHYHDIDKIKNCLKNAGFEIIGINKLTHIHNQKTTDDIIILAKKTNAA